MQQYISYTWKLINEKLYSKGLYLLANCTKPHPFPTGIFTDTTSPNWEKGCLRSSSLMSESIPPTNICEIT